MDKLHMEKNISPQNENSAKMTLNEFAGLVKEMRFNQRRYFAHRNTATLETCKKLERQVDSIINKIFDKQLELF